MAKKLNILHKLIPAQVVGLGTFVVFPDEPFKAFFNPNKTPPNASIEVKAATDYNISIAGGGTDLSLNNILSAGCKLNSEASMDLEAATLTLQKILNYDDWFKTICATKETRHWFENQLEKYGARNLRLYFVVGLQTVRNASLMLRGSETVEAKISAQVPVSQILGDPIVLSKLLNPSAGADIKLINASGQAFSVNETVYAVQYAEVKFKYLSSKTLAKILGRSSIAQASLENETRWVVMGTDAGGVSEDEESYEKDSDTDEDNEDMIEVELCIDNEGE